MLTSIYKCFTSTPAEQFHLGFLRHLVGIRKGVPACMVYTELGRAPLVTAMFTRVVQFWNRVVQLPRHWLVRRVLSDNIDCALDGYNAMWFVQLQ
jgi:hypothetical protein